MKVIIVDDSRLARLEMRRLLQEHPEVTILDEAQNADEAQKLIETLQPDLVFLDIQMPGRNGFELLEQLESVPLVVFTTAYDEYALKAFDFNALDYLQKPIKLQRLTAAVTKAGKHLQKDNRQQQEPFRGLLYEHDQVFVRDGERCWFVRLAEVKFLETCGNYSQLYFGNEKPLIQRSLNYMEQRLDPKVFFRASRQQIVNLKWIDKIDPWFSGSLKLHLRGGGELEVSRRQALRFKELLSI